jgi:hypothetical protein
MARDWTSILERARVESKIIWDNRKGFEKYKALEIVRGRLELVDINYAEALEGLQSLNIDNYRDHIVGVFMIKKKERHFILTYSAEMPVCKRPCTFTLFCLHKLSPERRLEMRQKHPQEYAEWKNFCKGFYHSWYLQAHHQPDFVLPTLPSSSSSQPNIDEHLTYETSLKFLFDSKFLTLGTYHNSNLSIDVYLMNEKGQKFVLRRYKLDLTPLPYWRRFDSVFFNFVMHILECASTSKENELLEYVHRAQKKDRARKNDRRGNQ